MKTIKELTQEEKYNNMLKRKNKHIKELKEDLKEYKQIGIMQFERPYAKRYLEEKKKEIPNLLYPDSETIYKEYYSLRDNIKELANMFYEKFRINQNGFYSITETDYKNIDNKLKELEGDK